MPRFALCVLSLALLVLPARASVFVDNGVQFFYGFGGGGSVFAPAPEDDTPPLGPVGVTPENFLSYLIGDDSSSTNCVDELGLNDGTIVGDVAYLDEYTKPVFEVQGVSDYIQVGTNTALLEGQTNFIFDVYVDTIYANDYSEFFGFRDGQQTALSLGAVGDIRFTVDNLLLQSPSYLLDTGRYMHIRGAKLGRSAYLFVDNVCVATNLSADNVINQADYIKIGTDDHSIASRTIYARFAYAEISTNKVSTYADLVTDTAEKYASYTNNAGLKYLPWDKNIQLDVGENDTVSIAYDYSGNSNNAVLNFNSTLHDATNGMKKFIRSDGTSDNLYASNGLATGSEYLTFDWYGTVAVPSAYDGFVTCRGTLSQTFMGMGMHAGNELYYQQVPDNIVSPYIVPAGGYHHYRMVKDSTNLYLFADSVLVTNATLTERKFYSCGRGVYFNYDSGQTGRSINGDMLYAGVKTNQYADYDAILADTIATHEAYKLGAGLSSKASSDLNLDATKVFDMTSNGDGSAPQDGSTNNATVTATQLANYDLGVTNGASTYNGSTSKCDMDDILDLGLSDRTFSIWARSATAALQYYIGKGILTGTATPQGFGIYQDASGYPVAQIRNGATVISAVSSQAVTDDVWHHIVGKVDRDSTNGLVVYIDGIPAATNDPSGQSAVDYNSGHHFVVGVNDWSGTPSYLNYFNGELDEAKAIDTALTDAQIASLYTNESTLFGNFPYYASIPQYDSVVWGASFNAANSGKSQDWSNMGRNGNHGTDTDVSKSVATGDAEFNGTTSKIELGTGDVPLTNDNWSISWWMNPDTVTQYDTIAGNDIYAGNGWLLYLEDANSISLIAGTTAVGYNKNIGTSVTAGWAHYAMTLNNATNLTLYQDGVKQWNAAWPSGKIKTSSKTFTIGCEPSGSQRYLDGLADDFIFHEGVTLSSNEVKTSIFDLTKHYYGYLQGWDDETFADDTVALYSFNRDSSQDFSGNGNSGTDFGSIVYGGGVADFNGSTDYINLDASNYTTNLTLSCWIKADSVADEKFFCKDSKVAGNRAFQFRIVSGELQSLFFKTDSTFTSLATSSAVAADTWTHLATTYEYVTDGTSIIRQYKNGEQINSVSNAVGPLQTTAGATSIGRAGYAGFEGYTDGQIDNAAMFDKTLTPTEIQTLYNDYKFGGIVKGQ